MEFKWKLLVPLLLALWSAAQLVVAQDCSRNNLCSNNLCCSKWGYCGSTEPYCGADCVSNCWGGTPAPSGGSGVGEIVTESIYNQIFRNINNNICPASGFYTYRAFVTAASAFPAFGTTGDADTRKREVVAFLAQVSHETTGGVAGGPYEWGLCYKREINCPASSYCQPSTQWPCAPGKSYCGRGPIQLSWNYNYGPCGQAIGAPLLENPELVETDPVISWKTAIWFWMTPQDNKPSCHAVMVGQWSGDGSRQPGFGTTTNIINGGIECGKGSITPEEQDRIGYYQHYANILGVSPGNNLDCANQRPFNLGTFLLTDM